MPKLFGVDFAAAINSGIGKGLPAAQLIKTSNGSRTAGSLTGGASVSQATFNTTGILEDYTEYQLTNSLIQTGDRKILLMAKPLNDVNIIPDASDQISIEGAMYIIVRVKRDPAGATYECQVRGAGVI